MKRQSGSVWSVSALDKKRRIALQSFFSLIQNADLRAFFTGGISKAASKHVCVPGLNCYSCPGALGACPLGSLQNSLTASRFRFPWYVPGLLLFFGALLGRAVCGFLCPMGWIQDLIGWIPLRKKRTFRGDRALRKLKYLILVFLVIVLPLTVKLTPFFCKYLCPSGTIAGILLAFRDSAVGALLGNRFVWKVCVLAMILLASAVILRPFCRYLCPLGAFYGLLNRAAVLTIGHDPALCTGCGECLASCPMALDPTKETGSAECIRCGQCISDCPENALGWELNGKKLRRKGHSGKRRNTIEETDQ